MSKTTPRNIDIPIADKKKFDENWDAIDWDDEIPMYTDFYVADGAIAGCYHAPDEGNCSSCVNRRCDNRRCMYEGNPVEEHNEKT